MKTIRIYLQKPWKLSDSPYYKYLIENPPDEVDYVNKKDFDLIQSSGKMRLNNVVKTASKKILRKMLPNLPNAHLTRAGKKYDLIHCAHCISLNNSPWVADIEYAEQFWATGRIGEKEKVLKILKNSNCKRILAWTRWSEDKILKEFPEIRSKLEVLYPGITSHKFKKIETGRITLLFSSRRFFFKGGLHALEVIDRLTKKYPKVYGLIVSDVPKEILDKYSGNKKIEFRGLVPQEELFKSVYPLSDIFVYPSYTDTFGFQITEALSFGLPVVCVDGHSRKELIEEGKTGFVVPKPKNFVAEELSELKGYEKTLRQIEEKTELIIKDNALRKSMSDNALREISEGKFSTKERNKRLRSIYEESTKSS